MCAEPVCLLIDANQVVEEEKGDAQSYDHLVDAHHRQQEPGPLGDETTAEKECGQHTDAPTNDLENN